VFYEHILIVVISIPDFFFFVLDVEAPLSCKMPDRDPVEGKLVNLKKVHQNWFFYKNEK